MSIIECLELNFLKANTKSCPSAVRIFHFQQKAVCLYDLETLLWYSLEQRNLIYKNHKTSWSALETRLHTRYTLCFLFFSYTLEKHNLRIQLEIKTTVGESLCSADYNTSCSHVIFPPPVTVLFVFLFLCGFIFSRIIVKQRMKARVAIWRDWHQCVATVLSVIKPFSSRLKYPHGDETSWAVSRQSTEGEKCSEGESDKCQWLRFISEIFFNNSELASLLRVFHACIEWRWQETRKRNRDVEQRMLAGLSNFRGLYLRWQDV